MCLWIVTIMPSMLCAMLWWAGSWEKGGWWGWAGFIICDLRIWEFNPPRRTRIQSGVVDFWWGNCLEKQRFAALRRRGFLAQNTLWEFSKNCVSFICEFTFFSFNLLDAIFKGDFAVSQGRRRHGAVYIPLTNFKSFRKKLSTALLSLQAKKVLQR